MVICAQWWKSTQKEIGDCLRSYTLVDVDVLLVANLLVRLSRLKFSEGAKGGALHRMMEVKQRAQFYILIINS